MIELRPKVCNICGGKVEYASVAHVYGRNLKYGTKSGYCYHCKNCGATVGTHEDRPSEAYGLLADENMRKLRQQNHNMFDKFWRNRSERTQCYQKLATEMNIPVEECHFAYFSADQLQSAYSILVKWWLQKFDR